MNIYELTNAELELKETLEEQFDSEEAAQIIADTLGADIENKLEGYAKVRKSFEAEQVAIKTEFDRLKALFEKSKKAEERLDTAVLNYMTATGKAEAKAGIYTYKVKESTATNVLDIDAVPKEYIKTKVENAVDKVAVLKALRAGTEIPGVELITNKRVSLK
jgi:hypothetical protein